MIAGKIIAKQLEANAPISEMNRSSLGMSAAATTSELFYRVLVVVVVVNSNVTGTSVWTGKVVVDGVERSRRSIILWF